ncbi:MAG: HlyD family efflux transporter periplasmic adaptor subunit [Erysipelotrichia bacterium]|nr:HlyD family efflux transporter periplasmic adaptor subunit [Erysipelotrichia bacterium]
MDSNENNDHVIKTDEPAAGYEPADPEDSDVDDYDEEEPEEPEEPVPEKKHRFHKPGRIILLLILIAGAVLGGWWFFLRPSKSSDKTAALTDASSTYVRSVTLSKGSLENTVTAAGTIASQDTSNVTTSLKYVVKSIDVKVGDSVQAGDTLVTLDTSELEKQIARKEASDQESYEKLKRTLEDATYSKNDAYTAMANAKSALATAQTNYDNAAAVYNKAKSEVSTFQSNYDYLSAELVTATTNENTALNTLQSASSACLAAGYESDCSTAPTGDALKSAYDIAVNAEVITSSAYTTAKTAADSAAAELKDKQTSVNYASSESAYNSTSSALAQAQSTYDNAAQKFNTVNAAFFDAQNALAKGVTDNDLEDLRSNLEKCTLKSETAGVVTAINATVGSTVTDSTVATIQNTSSLQITVPVDEYDIKSIEKGMTAVITSDAITEELQGTVSTVSPVATASNQGQSSSSFNVTVTINGSTDVLLIGMSAEVKIVLSSTGDVYTVPIDAVGKDDDGNSVIYVKGENGTYSPVKVTTGEQNDYFIEISGSDLKDGLTVRASADAEAAAVSSAASATSSSDAAFSFGMGGAQQGSDNMPAGGAPSGGRPGDN